MYSKKALKTLKTETYLFLGVIVYNLRIRAVSSAVEHLPYKQMATGSNPVPPIINPLEPLGLEHSLFFLRNSSFSSSFLGQRKRKEF